MRIGATMAAVVVACVVSQARADVLMPPPTDCPQGSVGEECHGPGWCRPDECTDDSDCGSGQSCQALGLCIQQVNCSGRAMIYVDTVTGDCGGGATCDEGECRTLRVCAPGEPPPPPEDADTGDGDADAAGGPFEVATWGCGCRAGSRTSGHAVFLPALLVVLGLLVVRRTSGRA